MNDEPNGMILSLDPKGDHAILLAAQSGDEQAFGILFKRYQRKIFAVALRYTRIPEDAEDIVQETFQKAFLHLDKFEGKSSFCTWLTRIAINEALMLLRRRRVVPEISVDDSSEGEAAAPSMEVPEPGPDPEATYLKREEAEVLSAAINELTLRLRTAIELRELGELSTRETARRMSLSLAAVKARVFYGRRKLRETLWRLGITARGAQPLTVARLANRSCSIVRRQSRRIASNVASRCELTG